MASKLLDKARSKGAEFAAVVELAERDPAMREHRDRWDNVRLCSRSVNTAVVDVAFNHNCGCCPDSPLQAWPFTETRGVRIYSDPPCFMVGERNPWGSGDRPDEDWEKPLQEAFISEQAIAKVAEYLADNPPLDFDDDDEQETPDA